MERIACYIHKEISNKRLKQLKEFAMMKNCEKNCIEVV